jgi:hypothetical protein
MTFFEIKNILCKNVIDIIRNLEIKFHNDNCYNHDNITIICILQSYISSMNKLECLFYQNIYILFHLILYS